jgi:hypothetical protein
LLGWLDGEAKHFSEVVGLRHATTITATTQRISVKEREPVKPPVETSRRPVSTTTTKEKSGKVLQDDTKIDPGQAKQIKVLAHEIADELGRLSGKDELHNVYLLFRREFGLRAYSHLPRSRFEEGLAFMIAWRNEVETARRAVSTPPRIEARDREPEPSQPTVPDRRIHEKTGIEMIRIPAGRGSFGVKVINIPEYWIGRYPVTNAQYKRFLDANQDHRVPYMERGGCEPYNWDSKSRTFPAGKAHYPVVLVSWDDAKAYCDWAGLVMPTEQQWEKAARGKHGWIYPWGNMWSPGRCNTREAGIDGTTPVGQYSPVGDSPYCCADMCGNVWEWTSSWYRKAQIGCVLRGGSWGSNQRTAALTTRITNITRYHREFNYGFRVAAPADPGS